MVLAAGGTGCAGWSGDSVVGSEEGAEVEGGLAVGDHADGLGLADLEGVGVAEGFELGGLLTDQVVEGGEVEGVAGDLEMGGAGPVVAPSVATPRWKSRTPQASLPCFSRVSSRCGS